MIEEERQSLLIARTQCEEERKNYELAAVENITIKCEMAFISLLQEEEFNKRFKTPNSNSEDLVEDSS